MYKQCKVGQCVSRNFLFLNKLAKTKSEKKRDHLLKNATPQELATIVEIAHNVVKSRFKLSPAKKRKLVPYATPIRELSRSRTITSAKRVLQNGRGFPLASLLIPVLLAAGERLFR